MSKSNVFLMEDSNSYDYQANKLTLSNQNELDVSLK